MKWVGGVTALLSLVFAVHQIVSLVSDTRERQRRIAELSKVARSQQGAADYEGAWATLEQALETAESGGQFSKLTGQLGEERGELRREQENLAMEWLANVRVLASKGQTFSDIVGKLTPVLNRGVVSASGARKADILAHIGWAHFLLWREGHRNLDPERSYREALEVDPANPYAHAHWAHWQLWNREKLDDARQHFSAAIGSGRAREYVRKIQLAGLRNLGTEEGGEFLKIINEMRKNNEKIDATSRNYLYQIYWFACLPNSRDRFEKLLAAVPATEQVATFRALFYDEGFDKSKRRERDACLAALLEAAGERDEALEKWLALSRDLGPSDRNWRDRTDAAIKRLSAR